VTKECKLKRAVIKEELIELTGDFIAALALNQFLYWSERVRDFDKFIEEERERDPDASIELTHGWIYKSIEELRDEIMVTISTRTLRRRVDYLVENDWLARRRNPRYRWDKTYQYRPDIRKIQRDLDAIGYVLAGYPLDKETPSIRQGVTSEGLGVTSEGLGVTALPETTTETTPERGPLSHVLSIGKHKNKTISQVIEAGNAEYIRWLAGRPADTDENVRAARCIVANLPVIGSRREGVWTEAELEKARAESAAETPLDPDVYLREDA